MSGRQEWGSAFPNPGFDNGPGNCRGKPDVGMSLRDWFAGQALASLAHDITIQDVGKIAYQYADAMLEARK